MKDIYFILSIVPLVLACSYTEPDYMASKAYQDRPQMTESLFASDQAVLGNEVIDKILASKIALPEKGRIAVLRLGTKGNWCWWSEELARLNQDAVNRLIGKLQTCRRVADASILPSMLTPEKHTVPHLREAAARYQADLLFIYRSDTYTFEKQRLLAADEAKANCYVESVLLDIRTGIVPFTAAVVKTYTAKKSPEDINFDETVRKAELKALGEALDEIADNLVKFLDSVPSEGTNR